jgi:hypothetical protein
MEEILYKITFSGNETPVEGCESMTDEQATAWLNENQEYFAEPNESGDTVKYIRVPLTAE